MRIYHPIALVLSVSTLAPSVHAQRVKAAAPAQPEAANPQAESANDQVNIAVGETATLSARGVRNWSEGVPGVVDVRPTGDAEKLLVSGRRPGSTTILLIRENGQQHTYTVNVFARSPGAVERELQQWLEGFTTLRVRRIGSHHVIDGTVQDEAEKARVDHVASLYPGQVDSMVYIGAPTKLEGDSSGETRRFLVRIDFYFVQMATSAGYAVGLGWPASFGSTATLNANFDLLAGTFTQGAFTLVKQPLPRLDLAASKGWGKVLKHATVVTNSGESAKFRSGGVQNFTVNTGLTVGLQTVPFGVEVDVVPRFDPARRDVSLKISSEVSDLTAAGPGTNVPGRTETSLETIVNVKLGQSLVLSGIHTNSQTHDVNGLPLLSSIPLIGVLFGSHQDNKNETEGAIYIVPSVIESVPTASLDLIDSALKTFDDFSGNLDDAHVFEHRPRSVR
ncbi:MAG TPA: pilus assembly protein N-terminal domain-containing protein [Polyangiaceae bacterium]|nr:pilus assembly protein N-terminal domain-containing protein [Polyangiaceae bacterium]